MIQRGSKQWDILIYNIHLSKSKSNRDILCGLCWEILNYEVCRQHKIQKKDHLEFLFTSRDYSSEEKFIRLSKKFGKYIYNSGQNAEYFFNPYKPRHGRGRPPKRFQDLSLELQMSIEKNVPIEYVRGEIDHSSSGLFESQEHPLQATNATSIYDQMIFDIPQLKNQLPLQQNSSNFQSQLLQNKYHYNHGLQTPQLLNDKNLNQQFDSSNWHQVQEIIKTQSLNNITDLSSQRYYLQSFQNQQQRTLDNSNQGLTTMINTFDIQKPQYDFLIPNKIQPERGQQVTRCFEKEWSNRSKKIINSVDPKQCGIQSIMEFRKKAISKQNKSIQQIPTKKKLIIFQAQSDQNFVPTLPSLANFIDCTKPKIYQVSFGQQHLQGNILQIKK
eukprot:403344750